MEKTAKPVQARSQKTREKLLLAALEMYAQKGYHSTKVDEIAAKAGVSTGIAYRYFRNKKDILLSAIQYGADNIVSMANIGDMSIPENVTDLKAAFVSVLKSFEQFHIKYREIHEELEGLQHTDEDVRKLYSDISAKKMDNVINKLAAVLDDKCNIRERAYAAIGIMEQHCHMMMNNELYGFEADVMRSLTVDAVIAVLNGGVK